MKMTWPITLLGLLVLAPLVAAQTCNPNVPEATSTERFTIHSNGTLTDTQTGLMWKQCPEGQTGADCASGTAATYTWGQALEQAAAATDAGYTDWRLPNIKELESIVETKCYDPPVNSAVFPNTPRSHFWSSSAYALDSASSWSVFFGYGHGAADNRNSSYAVRLVRGGQ